MNPFEAAILGIVEGISEFLPISSTGHLILVSDLLKIAQTDFVKSFEITIQLGAILAVVVVYFGFLLKNKPLWPKIIAAFLPSAVVGFLFYKVIKSVLIGNTTVTLLALATGGALLILLETLYRAKEVKTVNELSLPGAFTVGLFQSVSVIPGVSRSAASIIGGLFAGLNRRAAVEFSFLLAIPTMIAATALDLKKSASVFTSSDFTVLAIGFAAAFVTALFAVKFLLGYVRSHTFIPFGVYRIALSVVFWLLVVKNLIKI